MGLTPSTAGLDYKAYPVLLVDDEELILQTFQFNFRRDFTILTTTSPREALGIIESQPVAVLVSDQRMPEMSGVDLLKRALEIRPGVIPIILTGYTDVEALIRSINLGRIFRYSPKPWDRGELRETLSQAIEMFHLVREHASLVQDNARLVVELECANEQLRQENRFLKSQQRSIGFDAIVGRSPVLQRVLDRARRVAGLDTTVLIEGPTGTGKELLARAIHESGPRSEKLFVAVNTGAMTETLLESMLFGHRKGAFTGATSDQKGLFEVANGGTLFLDEIGETSPALQVHLLRALQEREIQPVGATRPVKVDVRIVAATNRDLEAEVRAGRFREDLLHRVKVFPLRLPGLSERLEDVPLLAHDILARHQQKLRKTCTGFDPGALAALQRHRFPGNVRELENLIERALILSEPGGLITDEDLFDRDVPKVVPAPDAEEASRLDAQVVAFERGRISEALALCDGNKTQAAKRLGLTYHGLLKKMQRYNMLAAPENSGGE